ncbi:hypothetical protein BVI2075_120018 [Burkholderia vietnamiensis]|nr:hypothetical protein BVI2075_120018 [Burkholderia vietnamiensis]
MRADERPHVSGRRSDAQLHAVPAGRRVRAGVAVERAVHDRDVEDGAMSRARQHRRAEDVGAVAADRRPARASRARSRHSAGRAERRARLRRDRRRRIGAPSGRARGVVHRRHGHRQAHHGARGPEEVFDGARRQVAGADLRRCRFRPRARRVAVHDLLDQRRALHGRLAHLRAAHDLRPLRAGVRAAREPAGGGRPGRSGDAARRDDHAPALGEGDRLYPPRRAGGRARRRGRRASAGGPRRPSAQRQLRAADRVRRRRQPDAHRAGGDLRAGRVPDSVRRRGRRVAARQRDQLRPGVLPLDPGRRQGASARARDRGRDGVRQQPERARPAPAVRRREGVGHRPRGRRVQLRGVRRDQERLHLDGLASHSALGRVTGRRAPRFAAPEQETSRWANCPSPRRSRTCRRCTCPSCRAGITAVATRRFAATG